MGNSEKTGAASTATTRTSGLISDGRRKIKGLKKHKEAHSAGSKFHDLKIKKLDESIVIIAEEIKKTKAVVLSLIDKELNGD